MSLSFIETQFPVSRLSKESYKERKANYSQTLTGLGKWWGRKPLILCRATILGLLLPATDNPEADRACFLALLTLDDDGLLRRFKGFQAKELLEFATPDEAAEYEAKSASGILPEDPLYLSGETPKARFQTFRAALERRIFLRLPYDQQIAFCHRPENIDGPSPEAWEKINAHLGTAASAIPELVRELGTRRFGRVPRVGDAFCGGGSIPFEAARIGCEAHASDLNPVAALLTWAALNIVGGGPEVAEKVRTAQAEIYAAVDAQVTAWGIEHKTEDLPPGEWEKLTAALAAGTLTPADIATRVWRADAYLYCVEVRCPETGWLVPLAPSWVIGEKTKTIATLVPLPGEKRYRIDIKSAASPAEMKAAKLGTIRKGRIIHPVLEELGLDPASIESVRRQSASGVPPESSLTQSASRLSPESSPTSHPPVGEPPTALFYDPDSSVSRYEGWLPHWQQGSKLYYVTWRLNDSLAQSDLRQWQEKRTAFEAAHPKPWDEETWQLFHRDFTERIESLLDAGYGSCALRDPELSAIVENALLHFDGDRYLLGDYVVMPNHVHVLVQPLGDTKLDQILHSWKSFTAKEINKRLGSQGVFWRDESFDHIVRSSAQWRRFTRYIQENPAKARLAPGTYRLGYGKRESAFGERAFGVSPKETSSVISPETSSSSHSPFGETPKAPSSSCKRASGFQPEDPSKPSGETPEALSQFHANGLRLWENDDLVPRPDDVFQERLYCVRWIETRIDKKSGNPRTTKHYRTVTEHDLAREQLTLDLLRERFSDWQDKGFIPSMKIEQGAETTRLQRERGWTHWHHLLNPRQLLAQGEFVRISLLRTDVIERVLGMLGVSRNLDRHMKLCVWDKSAANEKVANAFLNQTFNTQYNYGCRTITSLSSVWFLELVEVLNLKAPKPVVTDARELVQSAEFWVTDPPYADAVAYHELSELFLAWHQRLLAKTFPEWGASSRRALAVVGKEESFRRSMVDCYRNLATHMPDDGMQVVMFTHQDAAVWADLALILWASGLRVTAAWCIATETDSALKEGNYVQGTVLLILRKQTGEETAFLDDVYPEVEKEVKRQLDSMHELDDPHADAPDFTDTDYQLAAYAAALRVLTRYRSIEDIDVARELARPKAAKGKRAERSPLEAAIAEAVRIACDHLVPPGIDRPVWKALGPAERFYLKGLDLESRGEFRSGAYQELARGFGVRDYTALLGNDKANEVRLMTATEFGRKLLRAGEDAFSESLLRHTLFAIREVAKSDQGAEPGRAWLKTEVKDYWSHRKTLIALLQYLSRFQHTLPTWQTDSKAASLLAGALENDH